MDKINTTKNPDNRVSSIELELTKAALERKTSENENLLTTLSAIRNKEIGLRDKIALAVFSNLTRNIDLRGCTDEYIDSATEKDTRLSYAIADAFMKTRDSRLEFIFKNELL
jgi:hypothetical protein